MENKTNLDLNKYEVYKCHIWGFEKHLVGTYDKKEDAEEKKKRTEDSMYDSWIVERKERLKKSIENANKIREI